MYVLEMNLEHYFMSQQLSRRTKIAGGENDRATDECENDKNTLNKGTKNAYIELERRFSLIQSIQIQRLVYLTHLSTGAITIVGRERL